MCFFLIEVIGLCFFQEISLKKKSLRQFIQKKTTRCRNNVVVLACAVNRVVKKMSGSELACKFGGCKLS